MTVLEVLSLIDDAFSNISQPNIVADSENVLYENYEGRTVNDFFSGRYRDEITLNVLINKYPGDYSAALFFMTEEALLYYLPQFMKLCLLHYEEVDVLPLSLLTLFAGGRSQEEKEWLKRILVRLDDKQKLAISAYLTYSYEQHENDFFNLDFESIITPFKR